MLIGAQKYIFYINALKNANVSIPFGLSSRIGGEIFISEFRDVTIRLLIVVFLRIALRFLAFVIRFLRSLPEIQKESDFVF